jgi:hypothetical protein
VPPEAYPAPPSRSRRLRRRLLLAGGITLGTLAVLALAAWILAPLLIRAWVLERLERRLGVTLDAGRIEAGFGSVQLHDVVVRSAETGLPLARVGAIEADIDPWAVLRGRIGVRSLDIRSPAVAIDLAGEEEWGEVVSIARRAFRGTRSLGDGGGEGLVVRVHHGSLHVALRDELRVEAAIPEIRYARRRIGFAVEQLRIDSGGARLASLDDWTGRLRLEGDRVIVEESAMRGGRAAWIRRAEDAWRDAPVARLVETVERLARVSRERLAEEGEERPAKASAPGGAHGCRWPVEGTVRFEESALRIEDPALGAEVRTSDGVEGSIAVESCGAVVRLQARGDGGAEAGGWELALVRSGGAVDGQVALAPRHLEAWVARLWPDRPLPAADSGPVTFGAHRDPGDRSIRLAGRVPVPEMSLGAAGRSIAFGPERAAFELLLGTPSLGSVDVGGRIELTTAVYASAGVSRSLSLLRIGLEEGTRISLSGESHRLVVRGEAEPAAPIRLIRSPELVAVRPVFDADWRVSRDDDGWGVTGGWSIEGIEERLAEGRPPSPLVVSGEWEEGTRIEPGRERGVMRGRILAQGLRFDSPHHPLVALGAPGFEVDLAFRPGPRPDVWIAEGSVGVRGVTIDSEKIARAPLEGIAFDVSGRFVVNAPAREVALEQGRARVGEVETGWSGSLAWRRGVPAVRFAVAGSHTPCQALIEALPPPLRAELPGLEFAGSVDFHLLLDIDFADLRSTVFDVQASSRCRVVAANASVQMSRLRGTFRHRVVMPGGRVETAETGPGSPDWTPLAEISPYLVSAVVTTEDARFFQHSGVSFEDLRVAIVRDLRQGRFAYGGSTIDMQVVKNVFLDREKTLARKIQELILTWWMNQALTKQQIMELYLNVIEYGPGIYGVRAAAMRFFGRTPADLSPLEAVYLAKLLPQPVQRYGMYRAGQVPAGWRRRLDRILGIMFRRGDLDDAEYQAALRDEIRFHREGEPLPPPRYGEIPDGSGDPWDTVVIGGQADPEPHAEPFDPHSSEFPFLDDLDGP